MHKSLLQTTNLALKAKPFGQNFGITNLACGQKRFVSQNSYNEGSKNKSEDPYIHNPIYQDSAKANRIMAWVLGGGALVFTLWNFREWKQKVPEIELGVLLNEGRYEDALQLLNQLRYDDELMRVRIALAYKFKSRDIMTHNLQKLNNAIAQDDSKAVRYVMKAWCLLFLGRFDEAIESISKAEDKGFPENFELYHLKALAFARKHNYDDALFNIERAIVLNPDQSALQMKGLILASMNKNEDAIKIFDEILQQDPKNLQVLSSKGMTLMRMGKSHEASQAFEQALKIDPKFHGAIEAKNQIDQML